MKKTLFLKKIKTNEENTSLFSFIALFGLGITSLNFDFSKNFSKENKINLHEKAPCCNSKKSSKTKNDNLSKKQYVVLKKHFN